ncbi:RING finger protein [Coprinopsis sp. MPI-PUGE-AT-0042]|nr:RING finger protein [Coprinopsis sp. MPI-PUGE-AT-0042]
MSQSVSNPTNPNASVRKKRECNFYRQGKCLKGDACGFLHASTTSISAAQQSPGSDFPGADPSQGPVAPGPPEGSRRTRTGKGGAAATQPPLAIQANGGSGIRKKPCFAFRDGRCMKGLACTYSHDPQIRQDEIRRLQAIAEEEENRRMVEADARIRMGEEIRSRMEGETRRRKEEENRRRMEEGIRTRIEEEIRRRTEEKELRRREEAKEAERREEERLQRVQEQEAMDRRRAETERRRAEAERKRVAAERKRAERERRKREKEEREARERAEIERREAREARERAQRELAERQKRQREAAATLQVVVGGSNLVTFAAGFETRSIIPGFDLCAVVVRKFPSNATKGDVVHVFRSSLGMEGDQFHVVDLVFDSGSKKATVLTQTENTKGIEERALEGITFRDRYLEFELGANAMWGKMNDSGGGKDTDTLTIQWSCPSKTMILTYSTMGEAQTKARELDGTILHGRRIRAVMNTRPTGAAARYFVPESVKVTNVDMALQTDELEGIGDTDMVREVRSGVAYDLQDCIQTLEVRLRTYGAIPGSFQTSRLERSRMQAKARFPSSEAAQRAFTAIEDGSLGRNPPFHAFLPKGQQFTISIVRQQYNSQRTLWDDLAEGSNRNGAFVRVNESKSNGRMYINVLGSNQVEVGALKVRVENLVVGEPLASGYWHSSFLGTAGTALSTKIESTTGAYVTVDRRVQALRLFGTGPSKLAAKEVIREEVERLNFLEWSIPLQRQSVAFFVRSGLKTLQDALGEDNVSLNVSSRPATIKIKGGDDARHHLRKLMDEAAELVRSGLTVARKVDGGNACPICYDEVLSPDTLSCGHSYCEGCLRHYLTSAADAKTFPLICMGGEPTCGQPVAIPIIQRYLTASRMNRLVDAAFLAYLEQNPRTFKYCPTPDCSQIYRCDNTKESHQCPSCFFKICGKCDEEAHEGMTCEDARMQRNPAEQDPLGEEWALSNNAKRCPECRAMIIKEDGCNHVKCLCGTHFCWICLGVYSRLTIYMHMRYAHGGIRDAPAATPATPQAPATNVDDAQRLQQYMDGYLEVEAAQGRVEERNRLARRRDAEAWARERIREDMARAQQELTNQAPPTASNSEGSRCTIM